MSIKKKMYMLLTIITIVMCIYCCDLPVWNKIFDFMINNKEESDFMYNIGISFIAAYIFFVMQVMIPEAVMEYKIKLEQIPKRCMAHRQVQLFTVNLLKIYGGFYRKSDNINCVQELFYEDNLKSHMEHIDIQDISPAIGGLDRHKLSWGEYLRDEFNWINDIGKDILKNYLSVLPNKISYNIFFLVNDSTCLGSVRQKLNSLMGNERGSIFNLFPEGIDGKIYNIDLDAKAMDELFLWVNEEYEYLKKNIKENEKYTIFPIELNSIITK